MKIIGIITTFLVSIVFSALWSGYVLSVLWRWFMVPGLGLPVLTVGYAIGVATVVGYLTKQDIPDKEGESWQEKLGRGIAVAVLKPTCALGFGWIVTFFL